MKCMPSLVALLSFAALGLFAGCSTDEATPPKDPVATPDRDREPPPQGSVDDPSAPITDDPTPVTEDKDAEEMHLRADLATETMMLRYWPQISSPKHNGYWTYAHDWNVIVDGTERRGPDAWSGTIRMFYDAQAARGWLVDFYDDEEWMTLTLIHAYQVTKDVTYLTKAKEIFQDIRGAWDTTCCGEHPGGLWWNKQKASKVTASNAGAVIAGALLYEITNDAGYLTSARQYWDYWSTYMFDPTTGHVYDNIDPKTGVINKSFSFTYNEGLFIGAAVALARATNDPSLLAFAHKAASYMLSEEVDPTPIGTVLSDGPCGSKGGDDGEQFKGIGARYLADLYLVDKSKTEYKDLLVRSSNAIWAYARDPKTSLISCYWPGPHQPDFTSVNALSSAAMTLAVTASLMGKAAQRPVLEYQAEEATLHNIGLEASQPGFEGWGYVAGWGGDGQWLDFALNIPAAGNYDVEFRYASSSAASREISVNGPVVEKKLEFPNTGGYDKYLTVTKTIPLLAGRNSLSVIFRPSSGSSGFLNLDRIRLTAK